MQILFPFFSLLLISTSCKEAPASTKKEANPVVISRMDTIPAPLVPVPKRYTQLIYEKKEILKAAPGTKSVLFNTSGTKIYAMNLEGMSVYEFDQASRKLSREFKFKPTRGTGWDYVHSKPIPSFQEKPVEACFSHDDKLLWVSLHNADGIVPIRLDDFSKNTAKPGKGQKTKPVTVVYPGSTRKDSFHVPLIETGKTPKVIARSADSKHLLVSNWHSYSISVLEMDEAQSPFGKVTATIPVSDIPRGIAVDDRNKKSFVAIMGGSSIVRLDNETWKADSTLSVWSSPRHVIMDTSGHLFVSYNSIGQIACLDAQSGKQLFAVKTHAQPRTIALSKNHKFIFATCYTSDMVDVYKINADNFEKVASLPCEGHPVGVDIFENDNKLEAWVCSYKKGEIHVYSFRKKE